jgi:hypothetical protein
VDDTGTAVEATVDGAAVEGATLDRGRVDDVIVVDGTTATGRVVGGDGVIEGVTLSLSTVGLAEPIFTVVGVAVTEALVERRPRRVSTRSANPGPISAVATMVARRATIDDLGTGCISRRSGTALV